MRKQLQDIQQKAELADHCPHQAGTALYFGFMVDDINSL